MGILDKTSSKKSDNSQFAQVMGKPGEKKGTGE